MALSIQDRIRSMNLDHVRQGPPPSKPISAKPLLPPRLPPRSISTQDISSAGINRSSLGNEPNYADSAPPPPIRAEKARLPLPPPRLVTHARTPSSQSLVAQPNTKEPSLSRRDSSDSVSSSISSRSSIAASSTRTAASAASKSSSLSTHSNIRRIPSYDAASLPPLPPKRSDQTRPPFKHSASSSTLQLVQPPPLPIRRVPSQAPLLSSQRLDSQPPKQSSNPPVNAFVTPPRPSVPPVSFPQKRSALAYGMNKASETPPPAPNRPDPPPIEEDVAPPVPTASRPNLAALQSLKPKPKPTFNTNSSTPAPEGVCMRCRDFIGPDSHAARFPRESIPSTDVHWLAQQLTSPFESDTDRARVLFTWCHHNIAYNAEAFFAGNIKPSTPGGTIETGLAVCSGYAGLFTALASAVGLESVVLCGHGMGFAKKRIADDEPTPPENITGHAWNVVKIDGGEWKLIDACWGAGHLGDDKKYHKAFHSQWFCMDNNSFGFKHLPQDPHQQFRTDGHVVTWDEYMRGWPDGVFERVTCYSGFEEDHGFSQDSIMPKQKHIKIRGLPPTQRVQFMLGKLCDHWDNERMGAGKPYVYLLAIGGRDGRKCENLPFRTNGSHWWLDVAVQDLGASGQSLMLYALKTVNGQDARGWTVKQYEGTVGRCSTSFSGVAQWQLV